MSWPRISITLPMLKRSIQLRRVERREPVSPGSLVGFDIPSWFLCVCLYMLKSRFSRSISSMDWKLSFKFLITSGENEDYFYRLRGIDPDAPES